MQKVLIQIGKQFVNADICLLIHVLRHNFCQRYYCPPTDLTNAGWLSVTPPVTTAIEGSAFNIALAPALIGEDR